MNQQTNVFMMIVTSISYIPSALLTLYLKMQASPTDFLLF